MDGGRRNVGSNITVHKRRTIPTDERQTSLLITCNTNKYITEEDALYNIFNEAIVDLFSDPTLFLFDRNTGLSYNPTTPPDVDIYFEHGDRFGKYHSHILVRIKHPNSYKVMFDGRAGRNGGRARPFLLERLGYNPYVFSRRVSDSFDVMRYGEKHLS